MLPPSFSFFSVANAFSAGLNLAIFLVSGTTICVFVMFLNLTVVLWDRHVMLDRFQIKRVK